MKTTVLFMILNLNCILQKKYANCDYCFLEIYRSGYVVCRCKKYPSMELRGLFQYLVNQLKKGKGIELVLLQVFHIVNLECSIVKQSLNPEHCSNLLESHD